MTALLLASTTGWTIGWSIGIAVVLAVVVLVVPILLLARQISIGCQRVIQVACCSLSSASRLHVEYSM